MYKEFKAWFLNDKLNILLAIFCAVLPMLPGILSGIYGNRASIGGDNKNSFDTVYLYFSLVQFFISITGLLFVSLRYKRTAILDVLKKSPLQDYIEDVCRIKQNKTNDSNTAFYVVKSIVYQFYNAWTLIWLIWVLYFGVNALCYSHVMNLQNNTWLRLNVSGILSFLDFLGSSALYGVYVILNYVTVDIARRTNKHYSNVYWSVIILVLLFLLGTIFHLLYMFSHGPERAVYGVYLNVMLGVFGTFSFVLVLGALNSKYLNIPLFFIMSLYIYAVAQVFSFLYTKENNMDYGTLTSFVNAVNKVLPWITTIGKIILLMTLSWVLNEKRLIFYIVHRSLNITQVKGQLKEFNRYLS